MSQWLANKRSDSETFVTDFEYPEIEANWNASPYRNEKSLAQDRTSDAESWDFGPLRECFGG